MPKMVPGSASFKKNVLNYIDRHPELTLHAVAKRYGVPLRDVNRWVREFKERMAGDICKHGIAVRTDIKRRKCLRCHHTFWSLGVGHRICTDCKGRIVDAYEPPHRTHYSA